MAKQPYSEAIPDPGDDFAGCLEQLGDVVRGQMLLEVPRGLPEVERIRRLLGRAGRRYLDATARVDRGEFWPEQLLTEGRDSIDELARRLVALLDPEGEPDRGKV